MDIKYSEIKTEEAYASALKFARTHYENFPVVSFLVPKNLQKDIAIIYWFARTADDLADEGEISEEERIKNLDIFEERLRKLLAGRFSDDFDKALHCTINKHNLSPELFFDLLSAFKQDITKKRYANFEEVLSYAKRSANPVGRLILELYNIRDENAFYYSDQICTALQLVNFVQDTKIDFMKGRIYIPLDEMNKFQAGEKLFELNEKSINFINMMEFQVERIEAMFSTGKNLIKFLKGRLRFEICWTILGGIEILNKIKKNNYDVLNNRPVLNKSDFVFILIKTMTFK